MRRTAPKGTERLCSISPSTARNQLEAAATDIRDDRAAAFQREVMRHRPVGECRLGFRVDDPEIKPGLFLHPGHEFLAVDRFAHRGSGHGRNPAHPAAFADIAHALECGDGALDRLGVEPPGTGDAGRETRLFLYFGDHRQTGLRAVLRHQEPDRIGSDIDGGQALTGFGYWYRSHAMFGVGVAPEARASPRSSA